MKTFLHLKSRAHKQRHYWVSGFPNKLLEDGFQERILNDFSCVISEINDFDKLKTSKCFNLIVPEDKYISFISWLRENVDLG